jgi:hypothetical protein
MPSEAARCTGLHGPGYQPLCATTFLTTVQSGTTVPLRDIVVAELWWPPAVAVSCGRQLWHPSLPMQQSQRGTSMAVHHRVCFFGDPGNQPEPAVQPWGDDSPKCEQQLASHGATTVPMCERNQEATIQLNLPAQSLRPRAHRPSRPHAAALSHPSEWSPYARPWYSGGTQPR